MHRASCLTDLSKELGKRDTDTFLTSHTYSSRSDTSMLSSSDASGPLLQSYTCDDWGYFVDYEEVAEQSGTAERAKSGQLTQESHDGLVVSL